MISLILPTYHPDRVDQANTLYDKLKTEAGVPVEVIVVCDNPSVAPLLKHDKLISLPRRIGFTHCVNIAEKFATNRLCWWIEDYVKPEPGWGVVASKAFYDKFPDGMGIMELSGATTDCPKSLSTREFMYQLNGGNWLWDEYWHCGDTESWAKATALGKFYTYPSPLWKYVKPNDECRRISLKTYSWDEPLRHERESKNWPNTLTDNYKARLEEWSHGDPVYRELYQNYFNL